ncbi:Methyltransferase domain-containing protein [Gracilibacillus ureilyticus]|uniref:Methyltransferase domain-containing protein n=1 Tax=Gracilibacillus ureilyticus TaxID=531814 RepID=A0A1H9VW12_9BACI|nr:class I SAM-dependent methyltransferase [Gracilibacillus ureilyticus]SES25483.1 Methyltransferase domain-containing protein [Gracilibacillus ureilyticus]
MEVNEILQMNKESWEKSAERFFGRAALPEYGPLAPREDQLNLLGNISNKTVLDIGCGSGHSLKYMAINGARELWGLDLSTKQIETATSLLHDQPVPVSLFESAMEEDPGLPENYFDIVYSVYAIGWTWDLKQTFSNISCYLKKDGIFIFSWEHPIHDRLSYKDSEYIFQKSYVKEGPELNEAWNNTAVTYQRKFSTYINTLIETGFSVEKIIDDVVLPESITDDPAKWYSAQKAQLVPATFIVKAKKR